MILLFAIDICTKTIKNILTLFQFIRIKTQLLFDQISNSAVHSRWLQSLILSRDDLSYLHGKCCPKVLVPTFRYNVMAMRAKGRNSLEVFMNMTIKMTFLMKVKVLSEADLLIHGANITDNGSLIKKSSLSLRSI